MRKYVIIAISAFLIVGVVGTAGWAGAESGARSPAISADELEPLVKGGLPDPVNCTRLRCINKALTRLNRVINGICAAPIDYSSLFLFYDTIDPADLYLIDCFF